LGFKTQSLLVKNVRKTWGSQKNLEKHIKLSIKGDMGKRGWEERDYLTNARLCG